MIRTQSIGKITDLSDFLFTLKREELIEVKELNRSGDTQNRFLVLYEHDEKPEKKVKK